MFNWLPFIIIRKSQWAGTIFMFCSKQKRKRNILYEIRAGCSLCKVYLKTCFVLLSWKTISVLENGKLANVLICLKRGCCLSFHFLFWYSSFLLVKTNYLLRGFSEINFQDDLKESILMKRIESKMC